MILMGTGSGSEARFSSDERPNPSPIHPTEPRERGTDGKGKPSVRHPQKGTRPPGKATALLALLSFLGLCSCSLFHRSEPMEPQQEPAEFRTMQEEPSLSAEPTADYRLGTGDSMNILVYGEPDLTAIVRVSKEGSIELPLIGKVRASGSTTRELKERIEARLKEGYLVKPDVQIILQEYRQDVVHLMGQVGAPGPYRITHSNTLMETISKAGGFTPIAKRKKVKIIRKENGGSKVFYVDARAITKEGRLQDDVVLMPGDVIIVPERFF